MTPQKSDLSAQADLTRAELAAIVDSSDDAIISSRLDGTIVTWNRAAEQLYGYTAREAIGRSIEFLLPGDRTGEASMILDRLRRGESVKHSETVRICKGGSPVRVSLTVAPIREANGSIVGASHIARDMTQASTEENLARLAAIVESSNDAIIAEDLNGIIQNWNEGAARLYGYGADEVIGRSVALLLTPDRQDEVVAILERIARGEHADHFETVRVRKDRQLINVSITISPIKDRAGKIIGASDVARNVNERVQNELATSQLAAIVEFSDDAIVSKNLQGIILTWNKGAERLYGYSEEEVRWRPITLLLPPDRLDEEAAILDRLKHGERVDHFETTRMRKDGKPVHVSLVISPVYDRHGRIAGASHVARDVTDRKQFEDQLRQTQKLESLGVLAGGVAHDFNNLLTGILGNAGLVLESMPDTDPKRPILNQVVIASERASLLTRQLLAYAGKGRFVTEPINLSDLIEEISGLLGTSISKNVRLRLNLQKNLPPVDADAGQLQQVIMNLVINGAEAIGTETAGTVVVSTGVQEVDENYLRVVVGLDGLKAGTYVAVDVHDTGIGMAESVIEKIFDPFFTTKFAGRGLGLAAVLGIVKGHGGGLKVYSVPGAGSTFKLLLPTTEKSYRYVAPLASDLSGTGTILVVDDEATVRTVAKHSLERYGYQVLLASDGQEALEMVREHAAKLSLVLLDLTMPVMSGEETLRNIRIIRPGLPVMLSSGFNEVETVRQFTGQGLAGFIQKPYAARQLAHQVKAALEAFNPGSPEGAS